MDVVSTGHPRPLVANKGRERTGVTSIVIGFGCILDFFPWTSPRVQTYLAGITAKRIPRRILVAVDVAIHEGITQLWKPTNHLTHQRVISGKRRISTDLRLSEKIAVIRNHRVIERPSQSHRSRGQTFCIVGLNADRLTTRESIRIAGCRQRTLSPGIERKSCVDVSISKEGLANRIVILAGLTLFGALETQIDRENGLCQPQKHEGDSPSQQNNPQKFAEGVRPKGVR